MTKAVQRLIRIEADSAGNPPATIHLLSVGHWHTPWHGAFEHTPADLAEMVINFEAGVGLVENNGKREAPGNFGHDRGGRAAFWITGLFLEDGGDQLWGNVEWTPEGSRSVKEKEYKYISPEWNPRDFPWENPEIEGEFVENVFTGAALTNIPLFKKLTPVMASEGAGDGVKHNEGDHMDLTALRAKKKEELTEAELAYVTEHKDELTDEERTAFGLVEEETDEARKAREEQEAADADAEKKRQEEAGRQGSTAVTIDASKLASLEADAKAGREAQQQLLRTTLAADIAKHVARGAIKQDQAGSTVDMLMASSEETRKSQLEFMANLPDNKLIAGEIGATGAEASIEVTPEERSLGEDFGNTPEQIAEYKKAQAAKATK